MLLLMQNTYNLILLDVMLPHEDGFELLEFIKPLEIPVITGTRKRCQIGKLEKNN